MGSMTRMVILAAAALAAAGCVKEDRNSVV